MRLVLFILFCLSSLSVAWSDDRFDFSVRGGMGVSGVLVLCPGMNADGAFFLEENSWLKFADTYDLGVIALHFRSDPKSMYNHEKRGYYWPEQGSGDALLTEINEHFGSDVPILIYGFSGGAQFASRFVEWVPSRVDVWAAYSAQFWGDLDVSVNSPPGIVACGELDALRWYASFAHYFHGRSLGRPWTWVSVIDTGHHRKAGFEDMVRAYFREVLNDSALDCYVDIDSEVLSADAGVDENGLFSWLPSEALTESWRAIHNP